MSKGHGVKSKQPGSDANAPFCVPLVESAPNPALEPTAYASGGGSAPALGAGSVNMADTKEKLIHIDLVRAEVGQA